MATIDGGPFTQEARTGTVPMPDEPRRPFDGPVADRLTPGINDFGLPRIMSEDGMPKDYLDFDVPETPGADPAAVEMGAPEAAPVAVVPPADTSVPERAPQDPAMLNQPTPDRGRFRIGAQAPTLNQNYRYTNEDFYGKQRDFRWTDPRGASMLVPNAGQLPMGIWASQMQQVQGERLKNQQNLQKLIAGMEGGGKGAKTAPPYQASLDNAASMARNRFISDLTEQYAGNEAKAWEEIAKPGSKAARDFFDMHRRFEAIGQHGQELWERSKGYLDALKSGDVYRDPETVKLAEEVFYGLGSMRGDEGAGDIDRLTRSMAKFDHAISREKFAKEVLSPNIKDHYQRIQNDYKIRREKGLNIAESEIRFNAENFQKEAARSMTENIPGTSYKDNLKFIEGWYPKEHIDQKFQMSNVPQPSSSGGGKDLTNAQQVVLTTETLPWNPDKGSIRDAAGGHGVGTKGDTPLKNLDPRKGEASKAVRLMTKLGRNLPATVFVNGDGDNEKMIPLYIQQDPVFPTRRYIVGESATDSDTRADVEKVDDETGEVTTTTGKVVKKGFVRVPVEGNEKLLDTLTQGQDWSTLLDSPGRAAQGTPSGGSQGKKIISGF